MFEMLIRVAHILVVYRTSSVNHSTIDLHGTSVAEAVVIVRDILQLEGCSPSRPSSPSPLDLHSPTLPQNTHFILSQAGVPIPLVALGCSNRLSGLRFWLTVG